VHGSKSPRFPREPGLSCEPGIMVDEEPAGNVDDDDPPPQPASNATVIVGATRCLRCEISIITLPSCSKGTAGSLQLRNSGAPRTQYQTKPKPSSQRKRPGNNSVARFDRSPVVPFKVLVSPRVPGSRSFGLGFISITRPIGGMLAGQLRGYAKPLARCGLAGGVG
jgi:hypothetical protein